MCPGASVITTRIGTPLARYTCGKCIALTAADRNWEKPMLRITVVESLTERIMVLEGRLTKPYITEVESAWKNACGSSPERRCVVDLRNTTFIDRSGERILLQMKHSGARFIACGVSTTDQLHRIGISCGDSSSPCH
jgi:hypothetical protein